MKRIARLLGLAAGLVLLFLAAVLTSQRWLQRQTELIRGEVLRGAQAQLEKTVALTSQSVASPWGDDFVQKLADALGAEITMRPPDVKSRLSNDPARWEFEYTVRDEAARPVNVLQVRFATPPIVRLYAAYQKLTVALLLFAMALLLILVATVFMSLRRGAERGERRDSASPIDQSEVTSLARLAKVSVLQGAELARERNERLRVEEDLHFKQVLLNRALEEKIRLGHDLHDGTIQALYATGLTLEAAKNAVETDPGEARRRLDGSLQALNTTIRDVRSYIVGLSPESLHRQNFAQAVRTLTLTLDPEEKTDFDVRIDEEASARLTESEATDLLQIVREALSNSLRHGGGTEITIRLHESAGELCLLIQDNGCGFDSKHPGRVGHGMGNMQSRASRIGASITLTSAPGDGARLVLIKPRPAHSPI